MAKMGKKLVAMCSVAVGLIYAGAYEVTAKQANPPRTLNATGGDSNNGTGVSSHSNAGNSSTGNAATNATGHASSTSPFKDGTYTGFGSDRRGTLQVAVTIKQGKISDVAITNYDMRYSESYIDPTLPQEVVNQQNDNVDVVSGATASSENFQMAVQQALDHAKQG